MEKNLLVAQSGGPTAVINASLLGVIQEAWKQKTVHQIYGSMHGIDGLFNDQIIDLKKINPSDLEKLYYTPSAALGSVRRCLPHDLSHPLYLQLLQQFQKYQIHYFLYIGGNDSMDTVLKLNQFFKKVNYPCLVLGIPKTIDNDLVITDHAPGYGSAIKYIANTIQELHFDISCYQKGRVNIVEIMGRDSGWLTAGSKLAYLNQAGPDLIYLPEVAFDEKTFLNKVQQLYQKQQQVLICVSEGIKDKTGKYVMEQSAYFEDNDVFGHLQLGGVAKVLSHLVKKELNLPVRAIELNLCQRCASHFLSKTDVTEAYQAGVQAVQLILNGHTGEMIAFKRVSQEPYQITYACIPIEQIANQVSYIPSSWIQDDCDLNEKFIHYALPLIQGEITLPYHNGLIDFYSIKK